MEKRVIVVGGGVAGMQCAITLSEQGVKPVIVEKSNRLGGKLNNWYKLFPTFTPAIEVLDQLKSKFDACGAEVIYDAEVAKIGANGVTLGSGEEVLGDAVVICSGFELFDAERKEEYGYGIYKNVITTPDLEKMFIDGKIETAKGEEPKTIALLHCVGSRDEKVCQRHCSRVCCVTAVKQAIELKEMFPKSEVYNFYMDIRMFGAGYEELYRTAQEKYNVHFVRGRISEASETIDGRVQIKAEDTLIGRPLKMTVDMLVLVVGMCSGVRNEEFAKTEGVELYPSGFLKPKDVFCGSVNSGIDSVFYAGTATAPKNVGETMSEAVSAAMSVSQYLKTLA